MSEVHLKSVREIAKTFSVSQFGLYRKIRAGEIPAYHFGRKVLIDPLELRDVLRRRVITAALIGILALFPAIGTAQQGQSVQISYSAS